MDRVVDVENCWGKEFGDTAGKGSSIIQYCLGFIRLQLLLMPQNRVSMSCFEA